MDTHLFDDKNICETSLVDDDHEYRIFLKTSSDDIAFVPETYPEYQGRVMKSDAGDFAKWLRLTKPDLSVELRKADGRLLLRSNDIWLPLAYIANNIALPIYLNLVASYLYDRMKGALHGQKQRVHLSVVYLDTRDGVVKKFHFEGDNDALEKAIKPLNLNKFLDK